MNPKYPEHEHLKCPRCDSNNTKFCYYNNYNLSQPRHFCKNCRRYWTKGGTLRNIPIGGGTRKITKRTSNLTKRPSLPTLPLPVLLPKPEPEPEPEPEREEPVESVPLGGYSMGPFGNLLMEGLSFNLVSKGDEDVLIRNPIGDGFHTNLLKLNDEVDNNNNNNNHHHHHQTTGVNERGESSCWNEGESGWPDLSIFTPGSSFH